MSTSKPTFVLVPGAWHRAKVYDKLIAQLSTQGYKAIAVTLPSSIGDPSKTFVDDLTATRDAILSETTAGRNVVVVGHSYGGIPAQSAMRGLTGAMVGLSELGSSEGAHVLGLALVASGFVQPAASFLAGLGGTPPPFWCVNEESGFAEFVEGADMRALFYHDLPEAEGEKWVAELAKQSLKSLTEGGEHFYEAWRDVPSWLLATTEDASFPLQVQHMIVEMARQQGGKVEMREVKSGHSPFLSKPEETAAFLVEAAEAMAK